jgi:hypothetical protein
LELSGSKEDKEYVEKVFDLVVIGLDFFMRSMAVWWMTAPVHERTAPRTNCSTNDEQAKEGCGQTSTSDFCGR